MAELNVLLRAFQHTFEELQVLEHAPRGRYPKHLAFENLAWALGCRQPCQLQQHHHLSALRAVLDLALTDCSDACITQLTFLVPCWLEGWASRWLPSRDGSGSAARRISLSVVQGYQSTSGPLRAASVSRGGASPVH